MRYKYILPDGREFFTEKEGRKAMGIGTATFRSLAKKGIVQKILIND